MRKQAESGYALLLVFVMAATVAILLYMEMPRLVFEAQRVKEQQLINHGKEYQRAIQLYVRKFKKYPGSLDDLEKANNMRFLRRRYKDPMTGNDEWRLIHIDNAGMYTDSLIHKPPQEGEEEGKSQNTFITEGAAFGSTGPAPGEGQQGGAAIRGASDRPVVTAEQFRGLAGGGFIPGQPVPGQAGQPGQPQQYPNPQAGRPLYQLPGQTVPGQQPQYPQQYPYQGTRPGTQQPVPNPQGLAGQYAIPGQQPVPRPPNQPGAAPQQYPYPAQPGQQGQYPATQPGAYPPTVPGLPQAGTAQPTPVRVGLGQYVTPGTQPQTPGQTPRQQYPYPQQGVPGLPGPYGQQRPQPTTNVPTTTGATPFGSSPSTAGSPASGAAGQPGQGASAAMRMIQNMLTQPRPGGLQGIQGGANQPTQGIGGGIAGVATTMEAEGIMVYNERTKYNEWEFLYDFREDQAAQAGTAARGANAGANQNPLGGQQRPGSSFGSPNPGFGSSPQQGQPGFGMPPSAPRGRSR